MRDREIEIVDVGIEGRQHEADAPAAIPRQAALGDQGGDRIGELANGVLRVLGVAAQHAPAALVALQIERDESDDVLIEMDADREAGLGMWASR